MSKTSQEKAIELSIKFLLIQPNELKKYSIIEYEIAKQSAMICIDEIIQECVKNGDFISKPYWEQVIKEI